MMAARVIWVVAAHAQIDHAEGPNRQVLRLVGDPVIMICCNPHIPENFTSLHQYKVRCLGHDWSVEFSQKPCGSFRCQKFGLGFATHA